MAFLLGCLKIFAATLVFTHPLHRYILMAAGFFGR
jgi:hypothetical protein